jgi:hypothetical protein
MFATRMTGSYLLTRRQACGRSSHGGRDRAEGPAWSVVLSLSMVVGDARQVLASIGVRGLARHG